jgi:hypothetical protein
MHELMIDDQSNLQIFRHKVGFLQNKKNQLVDEFLSRTNFSHPNSGVRDPKVEELELIRVEKVEKTKAEQTPVYDLTVPRVERFLANGILVHNTSSYMALTWPFTSLDSATWMIQAGRAARIKLQGKSFQLRSNSIGDTNFISNDDKGPKRESWEMEIRELGMDPDALMNVQAKGSQLAMLRSFLVAADILKLQEQTEHVKKFLRPASLITNRRQEQGGFIREGPANFYFVISPSAAYMNFPVLASLGIKNILVSYYYVVTAPKNFWNEMLVPFMEDPVGYCQKDEKMKKFWDLLQGVMLHPVSV